MERLNIPALALTVGIAWGTVMLIAALTAPFGWNAAWVALWGSTFVGYAPGFAGAIVGFVWGFVDGVVTTFVVVWLYRVVSQTVRRVAPTAARTPRV